MSQENAAPVIVVTGGNAGIGLAVVRRFARQGYRLALCGRDAATLTSVHDELEKITQDVLVMQLDLYDPDSAPELIAATLERFGRIDVLVNNAGVAPLAPIELTSDADFRQALAVNCEAVFLTTRAAWEPMKRQGGGTIVNISSLASSDPFAGFSVYGACKAWVNLFTRATANEGRAHNIQAFALALGAVETRMLRGLFADYPAERTLPPEDVAEMILTLTGGAFRHASGQTLTVAR